MDKTFRKAAALLEDRQRLQALALEHPAPDSAVSKVRVRVGDPVPGISVPLDRVIAEASDSSSSAASGGGGEGREDDEEREGEHAKRSPPRPRVVETTKVVLGKSMRSLGSVCREFLDCQSERVRSYNRWDDGLVKLLEAARSHATAEEGDARSGDEAIANVMEAVVKYRQEAQAVAQVMQECNKKTASVLSTLSSLHSTKSDDEGESDEGREVVRVGRIVEDAIRNVFEHEKERFALTIRLHVVRQKQASTSPSAAATSAATVDEDEPSWEEEAKEIQEALKNRAEQVEEALETIRCEAAEAMLGESVD